MPDFKSISKRNHSVRSLFGDKMHISKMVKEFRLTDNRFETTAAAIRYYVHVGIAAETATGDLRHSLNNTIVKQSQKEAVRFELKPLANLLENLINKLEQVDTKTGETLNEIAKQNTIIESKVNRNFEQFNKSSESLLELIKSVKSINITSEYNLKNMLVLRSVFYVFLLGYKSGKIPAGEDNFTLWSDIVKIAHRRASQLSIRELKMFSDDVLETNTIQEMATEMFREILALQASK